MSFNPIYAVGIIASLFIAACAGAGAGGADNGGGSDGGSDGPQQTFYPTTVGAQWLYDKCTTNTITSATVPGEKHEFFYVTLAEYDPGTFTCRLDLVKHIKHIHYYGAPGGMSDLITYRDESRSVYVRSRGSLLEYREATESTWHTLMDTSLASSFTFTSIFVRNFSLAAQTAQNSDYIDSLPADPLGYFSGYKSSCYWSSGYTQHRNWEFYASSVGLLESYYQDYVWTPAYPYPPYTPSSTDNEVEHVKLLGYNLGSGSYGADMGTIQYSVETEN